MFCPAVSSIFHLLHSHYYYSILMLAWKYWGFTRNCHLDYNFIACWFGVFKMNHAALKSLSQNYFILVLYFNYLDILLLGLFFFCQLFFTRSWNGCLHLNWTFPVQPCIIVENIFLACSQQVWWQLRVQKFPCHHWSPVPNPILR